MRVVATRDPSEPRMHHGRCPHMTVPLTCPKCASPMRSYERNRVLVDQCTGCGGVFLDRGELESLQTAEAQFYATSAAPTGPQDQRYGDRDHRDDRDRRDDRGHRDYADHRDRDSRDYRDGGYRQPYRKKKKSFLSELFDD